MTELIDFFNEKGKFILSAAKNTKNHENSYLYIRGVYIFIVNDKGEILIQKRREPNLNRWEIPSGHVKTKESYKKAATRELEEETGIIVPLKLLKTIRMDESNEFDAFYIGYSNCLPAPQNNPEVEAFEFIAMNDLIFKIKEKIRIFAPQLVGFIRNHEEYFKKELNEAYRQSQG